MAKTPAGKSPPPRKSATKKPAAPKKAVGSVAHAIKADIHRAAANGYRFYVYALADDAGTFYIGKGCRTRVFQHERLWHSDGNGVKQSRIRACGEPKKTILAFFQDEQAAYALERQLIKDSRAELTNIAGGTVTADQSRAARAMNMLACLAPFDEWVKRLASDQVATCISLGGSLRAFYNTFRAALVAECTSPTLLSISVPGEIEVQYV